MVGIKSYEKKYGSDLEVFVFLSKTFGYYLLSNKKVDILCAKLSIMSTLFVA